MFDPSKQTIVGYCQEQFKSLAVSMWPNGVEWGSDQHRDIVRVFLAGCFVMDQQKHQELTQYMTAVVEMSWRPEKNWEWPTADSN